MASMPACNLPKDYSPSKSYPRHLLHPWRGLLQDAHSGWSYYYHEFMFETLLTQHGYIVMDMDYRGSAGYGRDWRTAIYRQMVHPEVEDITDGAHCWSRTTMSTRSAWVNGAVPTAAS